jgi:hypothetical protein
MRNSLIQKEMISAGQQNDLVMKFKVTIIETLKMTVDVETENQEQAEQIVDSKWRRGEYILDADNFMGVEFEAFPADI